MSKPVLFYSRNNENCIQLWKYLQSSNNLDIFIKICVDNNTKIPSMVTTVPSIYIKDRPLIYGQAIKMYLDGNISNNASVVNNEANNLNGILDYNTIEMGSAYSYKYSFIQENPSPMDNQYQFINKMSNNSITSHINASNSDVGNLEINARLEKLQKERNNFNI